MAWTESLRQAQEVLLCWTSQKAPVTDTAKHVRTLSLHVLSGAGFGKFYSFQKAAEPPKLGHHFNYRDALAHILDNIMLILIFGPNLLSNQFLPKRLSSIGQATIDFKAYMKDMYVEEKQSMADSKTETANIMASLIRASDVQTDLVDDEGPRGSQITKSAVTGLSESEVYGNTFVYNFAGHDTTAITLSWTLYLLAANPEVQDWIGEEINKHTKTLPWDYSGTFPKLKRCLAVMVRIIMMTIFLVVRYLLKSIALARSPSSVQSIDWYHQVNWRISPRPRNNGQDSHYTSRCSCYPTY